MGTPGATFFARRALRFSTAFYTSRAACSAVGRWFSRNVGSRSSFSGSGSFDVSIVDCEFRLGFDVGGLRVDLVDVLAMVHILVLK